VLAIGPDVISRLAEEEKEDVLSMIGEEFEIDEIDEFGGAWISKSWDRGNDRIESHSLALTSEEMELAGL